MEEKMAGRKVWTTAPIEADYGHTTNLPYDTLPDGVIDRYTYRLVRLTDDSWLANYQYARYFSFMGHTFPDSV